jgi:hypothetical protein
MKWFSIFSLGFYLACVVSTPCRAKDPKIDGDKTASIMERTATEFRKQAEHLNESLKERTGEMANALKSLIDAYNEGASFREQMAKATRSNNDDAVESLRRLIAPNFDEIKDLWGKLSLLGYADNVKLDKRGIAKFDEKPAAPQVMRETDIHIKNPEEFQRWLDRLTTPQSPTKSVPTP